MWRGSVIATFAACPVTLLEYGWAAMYCVQVHVNSMPATMAADSAQLTTKHFILRAPTWILFVLKALLLSNDKFTR